MGYLHINNLYKDQRILNYGSECYVLEKIHGTSANVRFNKGNLSFFSGGENYNNFVKLFNEADLLRLFNEEFDAKNDHVIIYGEAYGGKQQGMSHTYGNELRFIVFDIMINDVWLDVPWMTNLAEKLGFEVVPWHKVPLNIATLNQYRDMPSEVAKRRGIIEDKPREGIVIRPLIETTINEERIMAKHKTDKFNERRTFVDVTPEKLKVLEKAMEIVHEWVVEERLIHVMDHIKADLKRDLEVKDIPTIINYMVEDIEREAKDEIIMSKETKKQIGNKTVSLFKSWLQKQTLGE